MPSFSSAGIPISDRGRDLDAPGGSRRRRTPAPKPTCQPVCSTAAHAAWNTPRFAGVAGSTAVTLTANSTAAAAPKPVWWLEPERDQQQVAGRALQPPRRQLRRRSRSTPSRGLRNTVSPSRTRVSAPRICVGDRVQAGEPAPAGRVAAAPARASTITQQHRGHDRDHQQRVLVAAEDVDRREHDRRRGSPARRGSGTSATRASRARPGSSRAGCPVRRATTSARAGSPRRAGSVEDISTPMNVPCIASDKPDPRAWQRGLEDRVPRERAHDHRAAHDRERRAARTSGSSCTSAEAMLLKPIFCSASQASTTPPISETVASAAAAHQRRSRLLRRWPRRLRLEARQPLRRNVRLQVGGADADTGRRRAGRAPCRRGRRDRVLVGLHHLGRRPGATRTARRRGRRRAPSRRVAAGSS